MFTDTRCITCRDIIDDPEIICDAHGVRLDTDLRCISTENGRSGWHTPSVLDMRVVEVCSIECANDAAASTQAEEISDDMRSHR